MVSFLQILQKLNDTCTLAGFFLFNSIATHEPDKSSSNTALLFNLCLFAEKLMDLCQSFVLRLREATGKKSESYKMLSLMFTR